MYVQEHEAKVLDIDVSAVKSKLKQLGASKVGAYKQRRYVFNTIPFTPNRWIRLRTNGSLSTLALKDISGVSIKGTKEWEIKVDDFDTTYEILSAAGLKSKSYQENFRTEYQLGNASITIDEWPLIPAYLEIESSSETSVIETAILLGFVESQLTPENTVKIYDHYGINLDSIKELKLDNKSSKPYNSSKGLAK